MVILALGYRRYLQGMLGLVTVVADNNRNLAIFMLAVLAIPLILVLS
jgi:hypothetical protein